METEEILQELQVVEVEIEEVQDQIKILLDRQEKLYERQSTLKAILEASEPIQVEERATSEDWSRSFEWDSRAQDVMLNIFGISSYRTNQREIINAVMSERDVLVIMAAGAGKSLCYLLPAILRKGIALVVSPLLSLIQDQVMGLAALGVSASMLTSTTQKEEEKVIYKALEKGEGDLKVLYVTPEKVSKSKRFMAKLEKCHKAGGLSLIAIDEAHCCSQWGHDFRPDYKNLGILKTQFRNVPLIALTATATQKVQRDLMEMLRILTCVKFVSTVNRPNLFYVVREKPSVGKNVIDEIAEFIKESYPKGDSGIVYCFSRKECELVATDLSERGISARYYHADMDGNSRERVHLMWSKNKIQVIVGTVAFGMGINKPDVRFVIHHSLSKSMETYYQESGRAGRDGLPSECVLFFRPGDIPRQSSMVFYENCGLQNLYDIVHYCLTTKQCRRKAIFNHFSEEAQDCNGMCDNCAFSAQVTEVDVSDGAKEIVKFIQEKEQRVTMLQLVDKMKSKNSSISSPTKESVEKLIVHLILQRVLKEEFQHTPYATNAYVSIGPMAKRCLEGKLEVKMEMICKDNSVKAKKRKKIVSVLEANLTELRKEISSKEGTLPHSVLSSLQISAICEAKPTSVAQLEKSIGRLRAEKYGERIIEVIRDYLSSDDCFNGDSCKRKNVNFVKIDSSEEDS